MKTVKIPKQEVLHYMRYNTKEVHQNINQLVDELILDTEKLSYKLTYQFKDVEIQNDTVLIENDATLQSSDLAAFLEGCQKVVVLAVSLSTQFERKLKLYQQTDALKALIYDACGSAFVEAICDDLSYQFETETSLYTTSRFSPGYGDLALEEQKQFYSLLSLEKLGVELTDSYLMIPRKTVTALIGLSVKKKQKREFICDCEECVIPCRKLQGGI